MHPREPGLERVTRSRKFIRRRRRVFLDDFAGQLASTAELQATSDIHQTSIEVIRAINYNCGYITEYVIWKRRIGSMLSLAEDFASPVRAHIHSLLEMMNFPRDEIGGPIK